MGQSVDNRLTSSQRAQRNAFIVAYVKKHGDQRKTFLALADVCKISAMAIRDIWRTEFSRWNYQRQLKGQCVIVNYGTSTKRARYLIAPAKAHHVWKERIPELYSTLPRYTLEDAFAELARREALCRANSP
jgi:hypothetical protein